MPRVTEPILVRERSGRPGDWQVWLRSTTGLPASVCTDWTRRSLATAPAEFLALHPWPKTQASAYRVAQALVVYLREHEEIRPAGGPSVLEYASLFGDIKTNPRALELATAGQPYSPATIEDYKQRLGCHLLPDESFGSLRMGEVTQALLLAYLGRLLDSLGGKPCRTYQHVWVMLHTVFAQYARDNPGYIDPFVHPRKLPKPKYDEQIRGALTEGELRRMFDEIGFADELEAAACALAFWAGLRRAEIFALKWADIDFVQHRIIVSRAWKKFGYAKRSEGTTKGRKTRIVPMVSYVEEALKKLPRIGEYVITFADGSRPLTKWWGTTIDHAFVRSGIDAKARNITPHSSRHSIASVLLARGVPKEHIRLILGHFDERTTDGYLHMAVEEIDRMRMKTDGEK